MGVLNNLEGHLAYRNHDPVNIRPIRPVRLRDNHRVATSRVQIAVHRATAGSVAIVCRQESNCLAHAVAADRREPLAAIAVLVLDSDRRLGRHVRAHPAEGKRPVRRAPDVPDRLAAAATGAADHHGAVGQRRGLGLGLRLRWARRPGAGGHVRYPIDVVGHRDLGSRDCEWQPDVCASHQIRRHPSVAHVDGLRAGNGQHEIRLRGISIGANGCEGGP